MVQSFEPEVLDSPLLVRQEAEAQPVVHCSIIGNPISGKSTVAALLGVLLDELAHKPSITDKARVKLGPKRQTIRAVVTEEGSTAGAIYREMGIPVLYAYSLVDVARHLGRQKPGSTVILDSRTQLHAHARSTFRDQWCSAREETRQAQRLDIPPSAWDLINARLRESVDDIAFARGFNLIEIHRQGGVYAVDSEGVASEGPGLRARGGSEAGGAALVLALSGGLRSQRAEVTDRRLQLASDLSGLGVGRGCSLPAFKRPVDRLDALQALASLLLPSLKAIRELAGRDRAEWLRAETEEDEWPEAKGFGQKEQVDRVVARIELELRRKGYMGKSDAALLARAELLDQLFGEPEVKLLPLAGIDRLTSGLEALDHVAPFGQNSAAN